MIFLKRFRKYSYNLTGEVCFLFDLSYKVDKLKKPDLTLYVVYHDSKIISVLRITYGGQTYDEFKHNRRHGVTFKHHNDEKLPSLYATFKYGVLHGYYFNARGETIYNTIGSIEDNGLLRYSINSNGAISALYENGVTKYINCIMFDRSYSLENVKGVAKYAFSTTRVCDRVVYENLSVKPEFLHGWSKYGDEYKYYQHGKLIKTYNQNTTRVYTIYNDAITYKYLTNNGITNLEIQVNAKKDSIFEINPVTKEPVNLVQPVAKYTWYDNKLVILMERTIAPNYCTVAKYPCIIDHNEESKQIWTDIAAVSIDDYKPYVYYHTNIPNFIDL